MKRYEMKKKIKKRAKRRGRGMSKGSAFERLICKKLSLWWTDGDRDDIYWRTSGSGARAKVRSKTGQSTFGQHGDIQATDPIGQPLIDLCSIEIKRGYSGNSLQDLIDMPDDRNASCYENFIEQAITDCKLREDESEWILLVKRDRREVVMFTSYLFFKHLSNYVSKWGPKGSCVIRLKRRKKRMNKFFKSPILVVTLEWFLDYVKPEQIRRYWRKKNGR